MNIQQLLELAVERDASDLHLAVGSPPMLRVHGQLFPIPGSEPVTPEEMTALLLPLMSPALKSIYESTFELDFSFNFNEKARFRVNLYRQLGHPAAALRLIPTRIKSLEELGLPLILSKLTELKQGFVLVTGPTGHGKSTALAAFINKINNERTDHILTIEDPIEYTFPKSKGLVTQREMYNDTKSWAGALRASLREDPDVVLVGEMRDLETISAAITVAETGHLVFATLHTNSAAQSIDRIIDVFPENQQAQVRVQLAATLEAVVSLRLIPTIEPGRTLATEILFATPAARNLIREGKTYLIDNLIQTSAELGMMSLESSLTTLVKSGKISAEEATRYALRPELLAKLLK
ncbi:MAG: type IV pilus twitching motility protein PilT [Candidatus Daviesbacteria bacterium]|nr:type IV pilus twitching motility protein PilT [Candidatus Daviesbacteria bacterium]